MSRATNTVARLFFALAVLVGVSVESIKAEGLFQQGSSVQWTAISSPGVVKEFAVLGNFVFALTDSAIFRSGNKGETWDALSVGLNAGGYFAAIDADSRSGKLYVATVKGVIVSGDFGESFSWSFYWTWDFSQDVDFENGYGWLVVSSWGSLSGPNRMTPGGYWQLRRGDIPWANMSMNNIVADSLEPGNVAYVGGKGSWGGRGYRTKDGGVHWFPCTVVIYCTVLNEISVAFGTTTYSQDQGETWRPLGLEALAFAKDEATGFLYVAKKLGGVFVGEPGQWRPYGLSEQKVRSFAVLGDQLLAVSDKGEMFRAETTDTLMLFHIFLPVVIR